ANARSTVTTETRLRGWGGTPSELPSAPMPSVLFRAAFLVLAFLRADWCRLSRPNSGVLRRRQLGGGTARVWDGHPLGGLDWPPSLLVINPGQKYVGPKNPEGPRIFYCFAF